MSTEAAAFHGLATNQAYPLEERLHCALQALELYETEAERERDAMRKAIKSAIDMVIAIQANVAETISRPQGSIHHGQRAYAALTLLADDLRAVGVALDGAS